MSSIVLLSGGLDSTVLLFDLLDRRDQRDNRPEEQVRCLSVNYAQRHRRELVAAERIAHAAGCEWFCADCSALLPLFANSALTSPQMSIPKQAYDEASMKTTVVPNRNMIFLSLALAWAISTKSQRIAYAAHAGDHAIYPDCRPEFVDAMRGAAELCDYQPIEIETPFVNWTKTEIVRRGVELGVPFEETWSCYEGLDLHCGQCSTCLERKKSFAEAGVPDPTQYHDSAPHRA